MPFPATSTIDYDERLLAHPPLPALPATSLTRILRVQSFREMHTTSRLEDGQGNYSNIKEPRKLPQSLRRLWRPAELPRSITSPPKFAELYNSHLPPSVDSARICTPNNEGGRSRAASPKLPHQVEGKENQGRPVFQARWRADYQEQPVSRARQRSDNQQQPVLYIGRGVTKPESSQSRQECDTLKK